MLHNNTDLTITGQAMTKKISQKKVIEKSVDSLKHANKIAKDTKEQTFRDFGVSCSTKKMTREEFQKVLREGIDPILTSLLAAREQIQVALEKRINEIAKSFTSK